MASRQPLPSRPRKHSEVRLEAGEKVEAQDSFNNWYPARIVEVDERDNTVLIHFEGWNHRHDEWLDFDSDRLRGPSSEADKRRRARKKNFEIGSKIEAKWKNFGYYPAVILNRKENDMYEIRFDDNVEATVSSNSIRPRKTSAESISLIKEEKERHEKLAEERRRRAIKRNSSGNSRPASLSSSSQRFRRRVSTSSSSSSLTSSDSSDGGDSSAVGWKEQQRGRRRSERSSVEDSDDDDDGASVFNAESPAPSSQSPMEASAKAKVALPSINPPENDEIETSKKAGESGGSVPSVVPMMNSESESAPVDSSLQPPLHRSAGRLAGKRSLPPPKRKKVSRVETRSKTASSYSKTSGASREFVVVDDHNEFKCYHLGCDKSFRKAAGLDAHVRYYHHEADVPKKKQKVSAKHRQPASSKVVTPSPQEEGEGEAEDETVDVVDRKDEALPPATFRPIGVLTQKAKNSMPAFREPKINNGPVISEDLKPSHIIAWKKFRHDYNWHEFGLLPSLKLSPSDDAAASAVATKSAIAACRHALLADLKEVQRVMHGLDLKFSLLENSDDELLKLWMLPKAERQPATGANSRQGFDLEDETEKSAARIRSAQVSVVPYELSDDEDAIPAELSPLTSSSSSRTLSGVDSGDEKDRAATEEDVESLREVDSVTSWDRKRLLAKLRLMDELEAQQDELEARMDFLEEQLKVLEDEEGAIGAPVNVE